MQPNVSDGCAVLVALDQVVVDVVARFGLKVLVERDVKLAGWNLPRPMKGTLTRLFMKMSVLDHLVPRVVSCVVIRARVWFSRVVKVLRHTVC